MRRLPVVAILVLLLAGCSEPPSKELDQAQGAIDTAHAAGADEYAPEEYTAARAALQKAQDAVAQRDYRQALGYAIDARERAKEAARNAADGQAKARSSAEALITELLARIQFLDTRISAAEAAHVPGRDLRESRAILSNARGNLQKAGAAVTARNYKEASGELDGVREKIDSAIKAVDAILQQRPNTKKRR